MSIASRSRLAPVVAHLDMDAFFASVELRADPSLARRPVVVGGTGRRGVVASASYEARAYGIRSAMPTLSARRLCPHAVFLPGRYSLYEEVSCQLREVLSSFSPLVEPVSLDEAFLDVTGALRRLGSARDIAFCLREAVVDGLGLSCSVGVGSSKLIAKLASEAAKPSPSRGGPRPGRGVVVVEPGEELAFLHVKPVGALWGVGPATSARLARLGVATVGDLAAVPVESLVRSFGVAQGELLHRLAWARDQRPVQPERAPRSVGHEETYASDQSDAAFLQRRLVRMADAVASRVRAGGRAGRTVVLKVRYGDFSTITRSYTFAEPVADGGSIARAAAAALGRLDLRDGVRLLGVALCGLVPLGDAARQLSFEDAGARDRPGPAALGAAIDEVRARFGDSAVAPASLLAGGSIDTKRRGEAQWGPAASQGKRKAGEAETLKLGEDP